MPFEIDEEKLSSADTQQMDIGNPPRRQIAHKEFPKMVYLHPKDKTKEHRTKTVANDDELAAAEKQGYRTEPHITEAPVEDLSDDFEVSDYEHPTEKRGPGRPKKEIADV